MNIRTAFAAVASLGLLAACEPDPADSGEEVVTTAPTIDVTDSASEQIANEADAIREQAEQRAENIEARAEATAENIEQSAEAAADRLDAQAEKAEQ